jgi:hypothetical protein
MIFKDFAFLKILQKKIKICLRSPEKGVNWPPEKNQNSGDQKGWLGTISNHQHHSVMIYNTNNQ